MDAKKFWMKDEDLDRIGFSEDATRLIKNLKRGGIYDSEILMVFRTYGPDVKKMKEFLKEMTEAQRLVDFKEKSLVNSRVLENIWTVLKEKGIIKDFHDGLKEIDWFIKNIKNRGILYRENADSFFEYMYKKSIRDKMTWRNIASSLYSRIYVDWDGVVGPIHDAVWAYMKSLLDERHFAEIANNIYGKGEPDQKVLDEAKKQLRPPHVNYLMYMMVMPLLENGPLTWDNVS